MDNGTAVTVRDLRKSYRDVEAVRADRAWRARIGIVLQLASAGPELTVLELVRHFAAFYPRPRRPEEAIEVAGEAASGPRRANHCRPGRPRYWPWSRGAGPTPRSAARCSSARPP